MPTNTLIAGGRSVTVGGIDIVALLGATCLHTASLHHVCYLIRMAYECGAFFHTHITLSPSLCVDTILGRFVNLIKSI